VPSVSRPPAFRPCRINRRRAPSSIRSVHLRPSHAGSMVAKHCWRSASTTQASRPPGRVLVRVATASHAPTSGRYPSRHRRQSGASMASRRRATARGRRGSSPAGRPRGRRGPSPGGLECRRTRVARDRCFCRRSTRRWMGSSRGGAYAWALPWSPPEAASCRMSRQHCCRQASSSLRERWRNRSPCGLAACCALPRREGGMGCPLLHVRAMVPGPAPSAGPPLPRVHGSPVSADSERL